MFQIDLKSRKAIYEQIVNNFKRLIISGALKESEKVPSVREMATTLTVNPNTIQKAYRELENQGYFYTVSGQGSFISIPGEINQKEKLTLYESLIEIIQELLFRGEQPEDIKNFLNKQNNWA